MRLQSQQNTHPDLSATQITMSYSTLPNEIIFKIVDNLLEQGIFRYIDVVALAQVDQHSCRLLADYTRSYLADCIPNYALLWIARYGSDDKARLIRFEMGLQSNLENLAGPLHIAASAGRLSMVKTLVQAGADVESSAYAGHIYFPAEASPLHRAAKIFLYAGAHGGQPALLRALQGRHTDVAIFIWTQMATASRRILFATMACS